MSHFLLTPTSKRNCNLDCPQEEGIVRSNRVPAAVERVVAELAGRSEGLAEGTNVGTPPTLLASLVSSWILCGPH